MEKNIQLVTQGKRADVGEYTVYRIIPNRYVNTVGPFIFLDHLPLLQHSAGETPRVANGSGAHPHRGIATLTYIINGEADHFDSRGNHTKVGSGGAQWMKAGNGIIHDEAVNVDPAANDLLTHALQFWINLPSKQKAEIPDYIPVQNNEVPTHFFSDKTGWLKVIIGNYGNLVSKIPGYTEQFLYHIHLNKGSNLSINTKPGWEVAAFLPLSNVIINDDEYKKEDFLLFDKNVTMLVLSATGQSDADIILFGGEPYLEPTVAQGPFVMNTQQEIAQAYNDYHKGKYGTITYK
jgi:redox-sensitive bicupin YhaK (pirin superfamily)